MCREVFNISAGHSVRYNGVQNCFLLSQQAPFCGEKKFIASLDLVINVYGITLVLLRYRSTSYSSKPLYRGRSIRLFIHVYSGADSNML